MQRLGPFHIVYSQRERKLRDTIQHLVKKHGLVRTRILVNDEVRRCAALRLGPQTKWWEDMAWMVTSLAHSLNYGYEKGLR